MIEVKTPIRMVSFGDLVAGDLFVDLINDDSWNLFMRIHDVVPANGDDAFTDIDYANALNLQTGEYDWFGSADTVAEFDAVISLK